MLGLKKMGGVKIIRAENKYFRSRISAQCLECVMSSFAQECLVLFKQSGVILFVSNYWEF